MALFEFELARVEDIQPWGPPDDLKLSWFLLTDGRFHMPVADQVLFEYSPEIEAHWGRSFDQVAQDPRFARAVNYQIAAFARTMLEVASPAAARLPLRFERLASRWDALWELRDDDTDRESDQAVERWAAAWRWLGERSPCTSYLTASPKLHFVRVGEEVHLHWDNREKTIDGIPVWSASVGVLAMPTMAFIRECRDLADRLLDGMARRIALIQAESARPQVDVDTRR